VLMLLASVPMTELKSPKHKDAVESALALLPSVLVMTQTLRDSGIHRRTNETFSHGIVTDVAGNHIGLFFRVQTLSMKKRPKRR